MLETRFLKTLKKKTSQTLIAISMLLSVGCHRTIPAPFVSPPFENLSVEPVELEGNASSSMQPEVANQTFTNLLRELGTTKMLITLYNQGFSKHVQRIQRGENSKGPRIRAVISLPPFSFPLTLEGSEAAFQEGCMGTIRFELNDRTGLVKGGPFCLKWNEVRWTTGGHKHRRRRSVEHVLQDAIGKIVVKGLYNFQIRLEQGEMYWKRLDCSSLCSCS